MRAAATVKDRILIRLVIWKDVFFWFLGFDVIDELQKVLEGESQMESECSIF